MHASYGSGGRRRDVTSRLQNMVRHNRLSVLVNNFTMGGDPALGQPKDLTVMYEYQGQRRNTTTREGQQPDSSLRQGDSALGWGTKRRK